MSEVGIIAPTKYLKTLCLNPLLKLQMCYATLLHSDDAYLKFYQSLNRSSCTLILNCSPDIPRRQTNTQYQLLQARNLVHPDYVVLPSVDYNYKKTLDLVSDLTNIPFRERVGVLQGVDSDTLKACYKGLQSLCPTIALPCSLEKIARREEIIRDLRIDLPILYLEVVSNPYEEVPASKNSLGICTSLPVSLAISRRSLESYIPTPPPLDFNLKTLPVRLAKSNIEEYLSIVEEKSK